MSLLKNAKCEISLYTRSILKSRIVPLFCSVNDCTVQSTLEYINLLIEESKKPITLHLCSPGGYVDAGIALYDFIKSSPVPIYTKCSGMAASMAAILLGGGKKGHRSATQHSRIMIHQPSGGYIGKASDIEVHAEETKRIKLLLSELVAQDTKQSLKKVMKDMEKDFWMTPQKALEYGIIDKIC